MKRVAGLACALALAACSPNAPTSAASLAAAPSPTVSAAALTTPMCVPPATREIAFTAADAKDVLKAEAVGADCKSASILFSLRKANGDLVWSIALPATRTWAFIPDPDEKDPSPQKSVSAYMDATLKAAGVTKSTDSPDWPAGKERPQEKSGLFITTDIARDDYLAIRSKGDPVLCLEPTMGIGQCFYFQPNDASASLTADAFYDMHS